MQIGLTHLVVGILLTACITGGAFMLGMKSADDNVAAAQAAFQSATTTANDIESTQASADEYFAVTKVIDGDTITIAMHGKSETIRLIGIDTPETNDSRTGVQCFGKEASSYAKSLLDGKKMRIAIDETEGERDKYDRLLAYVYREDGLFINEHLIEEGFAFEYTYDDPYEYQKEFKAAEKSAKAAGKGLWAPDACPKGAVKGKSTSAKKPTPVAPPQHVLPVPTTSPSTDETQQTVSQKEAAQPTLEPKLKPKPEPQPEPPPPPPATQSTSSNYTCSENTYNCTDFSTQAEAQSVYDMCGGASNDVHKLDSNKDGEACESLP